MITITNEWLILQAIGHNATCIFKADYNIAVFYYHKYPKQLLPHTGVML